MAVGGVGFSTREICYLKRKDGAEFSIRTMAILLWLRNVIANRGLSSKNACSEVSHSCCYGVVSEALMLALHRQLVYNRRWPRLADWIEILADWDPGWLAEIPFLLHDAFLTPSGGSHLSCILYPVYPVRPLSILVVFFDLFCALLPFRTLLAAGKLHLILNAAFLIWNESHLKLLGVCLSLVLMWVSLLARLLSLVSLCLLRWHLSSLQCLSDTWWRLHCSLCSFTITLTLLMIELYKRSFTSQIFDSEFEPHPYPDF